MAEGSSKTDDMGDPYKGLSRIVAKPVSKVTEDLWNPYKELLRIITKHLSGEEKNINFSELECMLRKHKQNFFALLQNPRKNPKSREDLKKGMVEGIQVHHVGHQILSKELYQEALIISDMFDLNEISALDLLCTAQVQMSYYPGLTRGLVAVLLYYDGRKALVASLRALVQARHGVMWRLNINKDVVTYVTKYTDQLLENGLFNRILELLSKLDISKEIEKLQQNRALGGPKHHKQVVDLFEEIRQILADTIFIWAAQSGLPKTPTLALIDHLRNSKIQEDAAGKLENVSLSLQLALLSAIDLSILHTREDGEEVIQSLPLLSEQGFIGALIAELSPSKCKWENEGLQATVMLAFSLCLATLRQIPQSQQIQAAIENEDMFADCAIQLNVFEYLTNVIMETELLYHEEFYLRRIHNLITDFIVLMYSKVKELRIRADETARTLQMYSHEGLEPPSNLPRHFEQLLFAVAKLYKTDPLQLELMLDYWCPLEMNPQHSSSYRAPPRAVSLFKFVRLAGDMVPASLFVPYLTMMGSLAACKDAARHCFNMLMQAGPGNSNTISWDHFFLSLNRYYSNLRQESLPVADTMYRHRNYHKGITPMEIHGLHSVLTVVKIVAKYDSFSRIALCEHPGWAPLSVLLGLVSCSVPIPFKADLLLTLAELSKSAETAAQMWENLEVSQILVTIPSTSSYQPRGIQTELDEIESRMEDYPLTRALLTLLDVLTEHGVPRMLGAGTRKPGFDPYLTFIINSVFLKFNSRSYKNQGEKWSVAESCLKLLEKFSNQYEPQVSDFPTPHSEFNSPPGYHLMLQMNTKSDFFNLIMYIVDEGVRLFENYSPFPGQKHLEQCTLHCLNIIERTLTLQQKFFNILSTSSATLQLTNINKLLLSINPRTNKPDHCLNIARYVCFQLTLPSHSLVAVRILSHVTKHLNVHSQFMTILLSSSELESIRNGFVECLDAANAQEEHVNMQIKEAILKLLKQCLNHNAPNLTHFLFGFDLKRDISKTIFEIAGVLNYPRTCIHSLFCILRTAVGVEDNSVVSPSLLESAYHLLYLLCSNGKTCDPVLRFLRITPNFFKDHISLSMERMERCTTSDLNQLSWLLKILAVEMKVTSNSNQIYYLKQLTQILVGIPEMADSLKNDTLFSLEQQMKSFYVPHPKENLLVQLLLKFDFKAPVIETPKWNYFDGTLLENLMGNCQIGSNSKIIDVKRMHRILMDELANIQTSSSIGQRQAIIQEIQKVMLHVIEVNKSRSYAAASISFIESWRLLTEILFICVPLEVLSTEQQQSLDIDILQSLLLKIVKAPALPEISNSVSDAMLVMMENLRRCQKIEQARMRAADPTERPKSNVIEQNGRLLKVVLHGILEWLMASDVSAQKLRINLYASLVIFLHLIKVEEENTTDFRVDGSLYVSRLDSSRFRVDDDYKVEVHISTDVLSMFGEKLMELVCNDCIGGHDISKMLAMSTFSSLISLNLNVNVSWIAHISARGYLKYIIESILGGDANLRQILENVPEDMRPLYLYEAKMTLLTRLASTRVGAELLLEQRAISCFSSMKIFDLHPEITTTNPMALDDFIPTVEYRFLQIFFPALNLCNAILTSLGTDNQSAVVQIVHFTLSHLEVIEMILRAGSPSLSAQFLKELSLVTGMIARTANNDLLTILSRTDCPQDNRAHLYRIQRLMLSLLPRFTLSDTILRDLTAETLLEQQKSGQEFSGRIIYALQIIVNLLLYSRNIISNHGIEHSSIAVIFQPTLNDPLTNLNSKYQYMNYNDQNPSLGVVVQQLIFSVQYYHKEKVSFDFLTRKANEIPDMNSADLKDFVPQYSQKNFDLVHLREVATQKVLEKLKNKTSELNYCSFIIENCLYLIWAHLDYYMLKAIPKSVGLGFVSGHDDVNVALSSASEATWRVSTDDISNLKQGLVSIFNDSFSQQLIETSQTRSESDKGLIVALLRKIKRLIQFVPVK